MGTKRRIGLGALALAAAALTGLMNCRGNSTASAPDAAPNPASPSVAHSDPQSAAKPAANAQAPPPADAPHARWTLPTREEISNLPADGGPEFNRLSCETSPSLLQQAL